MAQRKKELALTDDSPSGATLPPAEEAETKPLPPPKGGEEPLVPSPVAIPGPASDTAVAVVAAGPAGSTAVLSDVNSLGDGLAPPPRPPLRKTAMGAGVKRKLERGSDVEAGSSAGGGKKQRALTAATPQGYESAAVSTLSTNVEATADDDAPPAPEYSFTVDPLMGGSFQVQLAPDASMFDLKDAIFTKTGVVHEMQLLGHSAGAVDFDNEEAFLDETPLPSQCRLSLSVRAATGKPLASRREEVGVDETEGYFVAELLLPVDSSGGEGEEEEETETETGEESGDAAGGDKEACNGEQGQQSPNKRTSTSSLLSSPKWTTATTSIPLASLASYLGNNPLLSSGDELHRDLASLRIEIVPISEEPERLTSPPVEVAVDTKPPPSSQGEKQAPPLVVPQDGAPPHRCQQCGVRCRLAQQFRCKCGSMFCPQHRFADQHGCRFDHKNFDRQRLQAANPKVCAPQVTDL